MNINILAGGPDDLLPDLSNYTNENTVWVGVDRGVFHLLRKNIVPNIAFGDFDSVTDEELTFIKENVSNLKRFRPEKDETDMELGINWALAQNPNLIRIFGATGGRLDHLLANVHLLIKPLSMDNTTEIQVIDRQNILFMKSPGEYTIQKREKEKYISFIPLTPTVSDLTLRGFKFPLENRHISIGNTLCISNELINDHGTFSFSEGILIVIRSRDLFGN